MNALSWHTILQYIRRSQAEVTDRGKQSRRRDSNPQPLVYKWTFAHLVTLV